MSVFTYCSSGDSYLALQRRHMFISVQTLGSRNRFAKTKTPFAKNKRKFIFKKIGDKIGDGSGVALSLPSRGSPAHLVQELCSASSATVPEIRQKVRKISPKSMENPAKNCQKTAEKWWKFCRKMQEIPPEKYRKNYRKSVQKVTVW